MKRKILANFRIKGSYIFTLQQIDRKEFVIYKNLQIYDVSSFQTKNEALLGFNCLRKNFEQEGLLI